MELDKPGIKEQPFYLKFEKDWLSKKNTILQTPQATKVKVLKVYKQTWWRKLLLRLGFKVRLLQVKVREFQDV